MKFKLGSDPEAFLHDGFEFVSAYGRFPGTKKEPHKVNKGAVQVDGMALEFNIDPAESAEEFADNIETVKEQMVKMVEEVDPRINLVFTPFARFDKEYFTLQPLEGKILGCDPDYDGKGRQKVPDPSLQDRPFRTAAGHVHIGWTSGQNPFDPKHFEDCRYIASLFTNKKFFVANSTEERERTKYYGMPSSFRPKPYGVELRSPSNLWVRERKTQIEMYNVVRETIGSL